MDARNIMLEQSLQRQIVLNEDLEPTPREKDYQLADGQDLKTDLRGTMQRVDGDFDDLFISQDDAEQWLSEVLIATARCQELLARLEADRLRIEATQETIREEVLARLIDAERNMTRDLEYDITEALEIMIDMRDGIENLKAELAVTEKIKRLVQLCEHYKPEESRSNNDSRLELDVLEAEQTLAGVGLKLKRCNETIAEFLRTTTTDVSVLFQTVGINGS